MERNYEIIKINTNKNRRGYNPTKPGTGGVGTVVKQQERHQASREKNNATSAPLLQQTHCTRSATSFLLFLPAATQQQAVVVIVVVLPPPPPFHSCYFGLELSQYISHGVHYTSPLPVFTFSRSFRFSASSRTPSPLCLSVYCFYSRVTYEAIYSRYYDYGFCCYLYCRGQGWTNQHRKLVVDSLWLAALR